MLEEQFKRLEAHRFFSCSPLHLQTATAQKDRIREALAGWEAVSRTVDRRSLVLCLRGSAVSAAHLMETIPGGKIALQPLEPEDFDPLPEIATPPGLLYVLIDVCRGDAFRNQTPQSAAEQIARQRRTPLTIHEGLFTLIHWPQMLQKNHCFSLGGSRRPDQRVPALWLSGGKPKLGWCWRGNPHTWLGFASCHTRIFASPH